MIWGYRTREKITFPEDPDPEYTQMLVEFIKGLFTNFPNSKRVKQYSKIDDKVTFAEFSAKMNERIEMYDVVLEIAYEKYRKGQFNDNAKMSFFRQMSNNQNLFK